MENRHYGSLSVHRQEYGAGSAFTFLPSLPKTMFHGLRKKAKAAAALLVYPRTQSLVSSLVQQRYCSNVAWLQVQISELSPALRGYKWFCSWLQFRLIFLQSSASTSKAINFYTVPNLYSFTIHFLERASPFHEKGLVKSGTAMNSGLSLRAQGGSLLDL